MMSDRSEKSAGACRARIKQAFAGRASTSVVPRVAAFTKIELAIGVAIVAVIATIAVPSYSSHIDRSKVAQAQGDIVQIERAIARFSADNQSLPSALGDLGQGEFLDPWGNPYQYLNLGDSKAKGKARQSESLVPINSDYDLYSLGQDGLSAPRLTARSSRDDVVRGRNGEFVGLAAEF
jgi:general secretion pathway protein G